MNCDTFSLWLVYSFSKILILIIFKKDAKIFGLPNVDLAQQAWHRYQSIAFPTVPPDANLTHVAKMMMDYKIVPTYIPLPPSEMCNVTFPYGVVIEPGMKVKAYEVKDQPNVTWAYKENQLYALSMLNIDRSLKLEAPWFVVNIPGCDVAQGQAVRKFFPPHIIDGRNRHVFLVYEQKGPLNVTLMEENQNIHYVFNMRSIAGLYDLGHPVAGNFFLLPANNTGVREVFGYEQYYDTFDKYLAP